MPAPGCSHIPLRFDITLVVFDEGVLLAECLPKIIGLCSISSDIVYVRVAGDVILEWFNNIVTMCGPGRYIFPIPEKTVERSVVKREGSITMEVKMIGEQWMESQGVHNTIVSLLVNVVGGDKREIHFTHQPLETNVRGLSLG